MHHTWHRCRFGLVFLVAFGVVLIAYWGAHTPLVGQTINGIVMPGNPYFHGNRGYNFGNRSVATQRRSQFGVGAPISTYSFRPNHSKPFNSVQRYNRPLITSEDAARIMITRGMGGWY